MTVHFFKFACTAVLTATLMAACGGGGGDPPATVSPPVDMTFALQAGYQARVVSGATNDFTVVAGNCNGTARISTAAATPSTFETVPGVSSAQVSTLNFTNCAPATTTVTGTTYYNATFVPIGSSVVGGEGAKFSVLPTDLPASVKVGQTGTFATLTTYTDSTFNVPTGKRVLSYEIKADTATTAITNIVTRSYDQVNLLATETLTYRMAENGTLTLTLFDVQFSTTSTLHLVYTPTPK